MLEHSLPGDSGWAGSPWYRGAGQSGELSPSISTGPFVHFSEHLSSILFPRGPEEWGEGRGGGAETEMHRDTERQRHTVRDTESER